MGTKAEYRTRQHDELLQYLQSVAGQHITAGDVCAHFQDCGHPIGTATVYRRLEKMVSAGLVTKYVVDGSSPACFVYQGSETGNCCHCKCEGCGRVFHMHCSEVPELQQHILRHHGFTVDAARTVFYGICAECAGKREEVVL